MRFDADKPRGRIAMTLHAELPSSATQAQFYRTNSCAQCGRKLLAPECIEHVNDRIVPYLWSCGHQVETSVYMAPAWHCYACRGSPSGRQVMRSSEVRGEASAAEPKH